MTSPFYIIVSELVIDMNSVNFILIDLKIFVYLCCCFELLVHKLYQSYIIHL